MRFEVAQLVTRLLAWLCIMKSYVEDEANVDNAVISCGGGVTLYRCGH